ncbi:outer envelope pore protein 16-3, chloroplastic/mitochondrial-like protein [Cinnamomum micranthum f. kanehirae]|uniref:Outer envelope pore protein 16-3, chloroplastic/mitochondrial-like protein n=1 Tax=Cinnamomum micranthum f. kanehirae TaxID=337451 RepID=A0A3S3MPY5_9MAGN|nr:outer envelope pore protein 16-3, chloroplastic/mitochondrial-like protein [Cinnamomum micranthum f. kanehirae]
MELKCKFSSTLSKGELANGAAEESKDPSELWCLEDEDTPTLKTIKGATTGFVAGTIWDKVVATWYDVPHVEMNVVLPGLIGP